MKIVLLFLFFIAFIENSLAMNYGLEAQFQVKEESTKRQAFGEVILNTDSSKIFFTGNFDTSVGNFSLENYGLLFSKNIQFFLGTASFSGVMSVFKNPQTLTVSSLKTGINQAKSIQFSQNALTTSRQPLSLFFSIPLKNTRSKISFLWQLENEKNFKDLLYHAACLNFYHIIEKQRSKKQYFVLQQSATLAFFPIVQQTNKSWFLTTPFVQEHSVANFLYQLKIIIPKIQVFSNLGVQNSAWHFLSLYNKTEIVFFHQQGKIYTGFFIAQDCLYKSNGKFISRPFIWYINPQYTFMPRCSLPLRIQVGLAWQNEKNSENQRLQEKSWTHTLKVATTISSLYFDIVGNLQLVDILENSSQSFFTKASVISSSLRFSVYPKKTSFYQKITLNGELDIYPKNIAKNQGEISGFYKIMYHQIQIQNEIGITFQKKITKVAPKITIRGKNLFSKATFSFFTDKNKKTTGALSFGYKKAWEK